MLIVMGIIAMLAAMLTAVILHAKNVAHRVDCAQNLDQIGKGLAVMVLSNNGISPIGPPVNSVTQPASGLSNAYPQPPVQTTSGAMTNNYGFPWWARLFEQWETDMGLLYAKNPDGTFQTNNALVDANFNPNGFILTSQLPRSMRIFHCPAAGQLQGTSNPALYSGSNVARLYNSISYGLNFDVKDFGVPLNNPPIAPRAYCAASSSTPYSPVFPNVLTPADKYPDQYRATEIMNPGQFIVVSEAATQDPLESNWTGGRIWMADTTANGSGYERTTTDSPPNPNYVAGVSSPGGIVGRHGGYANVLFADFHVELMQVAPGQTAPNLNVNYNTPLWLLPNK